MKRRKVEIEFGKNAFCLDDRHVLVQVGRWQLFIALAASVAIGRYKVLANGDIVPWSEVVAPDDWRNQPVRPNGSPW